MAAVYYQYSSGKDIFLGNLAISNPVLIEGFPMTSKNMLIVMTGVGIETSETMQYFLTFDDVIDFMHFGKGVGGIVISGTAFMDCNGSFTALSAFYDFLAAFRGRVINVSLAGNVWFSGPVVGSSVNIVSEPDTSADFSLHIAVTNHSLGMKSTGGGSC